MHQARLVQPQQRGRPGPSEQERPDEGQAQPPTLSLLPQAVDGLEHRAALLLGIRRGPGLSAMALTSPRPPGHLGRRAGGQAALDIIIRK